MKRIHYTDEYLVTGDDIAAAVVEYARALAMQNKSDMVDLPGMDRGGVHQRFQVLLGPASQMLVSEEQTDEAEITDGPLVDDIGGRIDRLRGVEPQSAEPAEGIPLDTDEF
ncbi:MULTISPECIES: hypothetical protein [unclassified Frigoribacterium]|uniref:hypothetical protein n=1 Tax=unclassified Frigoribacterium TaxID=2627005 RepID=UPI000697FBD2|nr:MULTISPECIES: hypothetical protein [unclassified Frigoribacterium]KQN42419.1 hypothetical protein ASE87_07895 [Frigoribacterium sp. Leaf44]MBD8540333.1 hypothetical protein [Frigoribacterium sp. CFBP 8751]